MSAETPEIPKSPDLVFNVSSSVAPSSRSCPQQIGENAGIHRARPSAHHQSIQRRKSHGRVDALAAANCRKRTPVAKVASNKFQIGEISSE